MANQSLRVTLFKDSKGPFTELLQKHEVQFEEISPVPGKIYASGMWIDIATVAIPVLGAVLVAFLKYRKSRVAHIQIGTETITVRAENYTPQEVESFLDMATALTVIETRPPDDGI